MKRKSEKDLFLPFINALSTFNDIKLIQSLFQHIVPLHSETFPLLINQCDKYGWNVFSTAIVEMFGRLSKNEAIEQFTSLIAENVLYRMRRRKCVTLSSKIF